jgi:hypothetical protein
VYGVNLLELDNILQPFVPSSAAISADAPNDE